jgi:hypothetical protein
VALIGKGLTAREVIELFPSVTVEDIREALLHAAESVLDENWSVRSESRFDEIVAKARANAQLTEEEALALGVEETRAVRSERAASRLARKL